MVRSNAEAISAGFSIVRPDSHAPGLRLSFWPVVPTRSGWYARFVMNTQRFVPIGTISDDRSQFRPVISKRHNPFFFMLLAATLLVSLSQIGCTGLTSANGSDPTAATTV